MSKTEKDIGPPSYEEVMHTTVLNPQQTGIYPNANVGIYQPPASAPHPHLAPGYVPSYGAFETTPVNVIVQPPSVNVPSEIIVIGACPACRLGVLENSYSALGLCCAIVFFPIGILCCLAMKTKRCTNCGFEF